MRSFVFGLLTAVAVLITVPTASAGTAAPDTTAAGTRTVYAYPSPGTKYAGARTTFSFRGATTRQLNDATVVGSASGRHQGRISRHPDGKGASLVALGRFRQGERVTVSTDLRISGARRGDFRVTIAREGSHGPFFPELDPQFAPGEIMRFRSRPDLRPPRLNVTTATDGTDRGFLFLGPKDGKSGQAGPMIADDSGQPLYFAPYRNKLQPFDFRVQEYRNRPVLTWMEGRVRAPGYGLARYVIADNSYRVIKRFDPGNGFEGDIHDFEITPRDTALLISYNPVRASLRSKGGRRNGFVFDQVVQELDIRSGLVYFEWHSLDHLPVRDGYTALPDGRRAAYDYLHVNSIDQDTDGDYLVSGRNTRAVYKLDGQTGDVLWRLGGKRSSFRMEGESEFAWQHDAQFGPAGTLTMFDNEAAPPVRDQARGLVLRINERARTATVVRQFQHTPGIVADSQGNMQNLPNGNELVGWGSAGPVTEFGEQGNVVFDAAFPRGYDTYRAYRLRWTGRPRRAPDMAVDVANGQATVYASWNGATRVARWQAFAGPSEEALEPVGEPVARSGFETTINVPSAGPFFAVRALDSTGKTLDTSDAERAG